MNKKIMTSIKLQKKLHYQLQQQVICGGYGMRGKSRWITEAIEHFLDLPDYPTLVDIAGEMGQLTDIVSIRVTDRLVQRMEDAVISVRRVYPGMEGVRSNLVRASIMQRLIRQPASVTEV